MADEKVKIELEVPKSEVSIKPAKKAKKLEPEDKKEVAGYELGEVAKAPLEPPEPKDKKGPSIHQKRVVIFGFALAAASLILWPLFSFWVFVAVAAAGALVVAYGTFVRI